MNEEYIRSIIKEIIKEETDEVLGAGLRIKYIDLLNNIDDIRDEINDSLKLSRKNISNGKKVDSDYIDDIIKSADKIKQIANKIKKL